MRTFVDEIFQESPYYAPQSVVRNMMKALNIENIVLIISA